MVAALVYMMVPSWPRVVQRPKDISARACVQSKSRGRKRSSGTMRRERSTTIAELDGLRRHRRHHHPDHLRADAEQQDEEQGRAEQVAHDADEVQLDVALAHVEADPEGQRQHLDAKLAMSSAIIMRAGPTICGAMVRTCSMLRTKMAPAATRNSTREAEQRQDRGDDAGDLLELAPGISSDHVAAEPAGE